jgi:hypothetical protein
MKLVVVGAVAAGGCTMTMELFGGVHLSRSTLAAIRI